MRCDALVVSAQQAPHLLQPGHLEIADFPDQEFLSAVERWGFMPAEVSENAELQEVVLPVLRADISMFEQYCGTDNGGKIELDIPERGRWGLGRCIRGARYARGLASVHHKQPI